jgi:hypothetical protein
MYELGRVWLEATLSIHDTVPYFYWIWTDENDRVLSRDSRLLAGIRTYS